VSPVNIYGASKLCAEKLFVHGNSYSHEGGARFSCCRYGNVVGSRGSVIPIFQEQHRNGLITITDPSMTRFWLTLQQGVEFVIRCIGLMKGGEVFVPKIPSMRIVDLAKAIAPATPVKIIGVRPGEKIHESLVSEDEARYYDDLFKEGKAIVAVKGATPTAQDVLARHGGYHLHQARQSPVETKGVFSNP